MEVEDAAIYVDATIVTDGLNLESAIALERMRDGQITGFCERGVDEEAERFRLTSFDEHRRSRLVVDETETVLERTLGDTARSATRARSGKERF